MDAAPYTLPKLRDELEILEGPTAADGSPTWTVFDPIRNRFFKLDWPVFEVLSRWKIGDAAGVSRATNSDTPLHVTPDFVKAVARFLVNNQLTRVSEQEDLDFLGRVAESQVQSWWHWLIHHYLFFRIPLVRPDRALTAAYPYVAWLYSRKVKALLGLGLVVGLYLVMRQWETFRASLVEAFSLQGLAYFIIALGCSKIGHELGHAFTAKRYGCHVPTMGVAFLVLWPMLFTDCNESWKLKDRRQRLSIASAGMAVELSIAIIATLLWSFLPQGHARDMAFVLASTTWVSSLLINVSPFMRFDGYFLLSDWLDFPNLHDRSFALARWKLREILFDLGAPPPEIHPPRLNRFLIVFAVCVWIYRLLLFLGIAVLVYHFFIKIVGIVLFGVEIVWFVLRPLWTEIGQWRKRWDGIRKKSRARWSALILAGLILVFLIPWQSTVYVPALAEAGQFQHIYLAADGRLIAPLPEEGKVLEEGEIFARLENPDLPHQRDRLMARKQALEYELGAGAFATEFRERNDVIVADIAGVDTELEALEQKREKLLVKAPTAGTLMDLEPGLDKGQWLSKGQRVGAIRTGSEDVIIAYVDEDDVFRVRQGATGMFYSREPGLLAEPCRVQLVEKTASTLLAEPSFASAFGGEIPVRASSAGLMPDRAVYRVRLSFEDGRQRSGFQIPGHVSIAADRASPVARVWNWALAVLIRESGM